METVHKEILQILLERVHTQGLISQETYEKARALAASPQCPQPLWNQKMPNQEQPHEHP